MVYQNAQMLQHLHVRGPNPLLYNVPDGRAQRLSSWRISVVNAPSAPRKRPTAARAYVACVVVSPLLPLRSGILLRFLPGSHNAVRWDCAWRRLRRGALYAGKLRHGECHPSSWVAYRSSPRSSSVDRPARYSSPYLRRSTAILLAQPSGGGPRPADPGRLSRLLVLLSRTAARGSQVFCHVRPGHPGGRARVLRPRRPDRPDTDAPEVRLLDARGRGGDRGARPAFGCPDRSRRRLLPRSQWPPSGRSRRSPSSPAPPSRWWRSTSSGTTARRR